jgi:elongation factor Ts
MREITVTLVKTLRERTGAGIIACRNALMETHGDLDAAIDKLRAMESSRATRTAERVASEGLVGVSVEDTRGAIVELNAETDFVSRNQAFRGAVSALARLALVVNGDLDSLLDRPSPDGEGRVLDLVARLSARTGERVVLRRTGFVSVDRGVVASYVHNAAAPGLGSIGVLIALDSPGPAAPLAEIGRKIAMHVAASAPQWISREAIPAEVLAEKRAVLMNEARETGKPIAIVEKMVEGRMRKFLDEVVLGVQPFVLDPDRTVSQVLEDAERSIGSTIAVTAFVRFRVGEGLAVRANAGA